MKWSVMEMHDSVAIDVNASQFKEILPALSSGSQGLEQQLRYIVLPYSL